MSTSCDFCAYNEYDEDDEAYYCSVNMDEDDMARFMQSSYKECPYYRSGDEYKVVRQQMYSCSTSKGAMEVFSYKGRKRAHYILFSEKFAS